MKHKTKRMVKIYELTDKCFMGFSVKQDSKFTFHHCIKKEYGGMLLISQNGGIFHEIILHNQTTHFDSLVFFSLFYPVFIVAF